MPYGGRSPEQLMTIAEQDISFLQGFDVKLIIAACGSVSTHALPTLAPKISVPVFGVIEPAVEESTRLTKNKRIGIAATETTIAGGAFQRAVRVLDPQVGVFDVACPKFVPLIEAGKLSGGEIDSAIDEYFAPLKDAGIDTLLLGCTHYPLISGAITDFFGGEITLVGSGETAAQRLAEATRELELESALPLGGVTYFTSGDAVQFDEMARLILGNSMRIAAEYVEPFPLYRTC